MTLMLAPAFMPRLHMPAVGENRVLAGAPHWPRNLVELRALPKTVDAYVSDNLPVRSLFIAGVNYLRYRLGYSGTPQVIVGKEGWLFYDNGSHLAEARHADPLNQRQRERWIGTLVARTEQLKKRNVAYVVLSAPMKERIYNDKAPSWAKSKNAPGDAETIGTEVRRAGYINFVNPYAALIAQRLSQPDLYSPFDIHWTGKGAYVAYSRLMAIFKELGLPVEPLPLDHFSPVRSRPEELPRDTALMLGVSSFIKCRFPRFFDPAVGPNIRINYLTDKHDWSGARVVDTGLRDKPVIQLTLDSFASDLLPFLYPHFSRVVISHHQDGFYREDLTEIYKPDVCVLEFVESGLPYVMTPVIRPSDALQERIAAAVAVDARSGTP